MQLKGFEIETPIDILVTTRNRPDCLQETLTHIYRRTTTPYRLHVIDDDSEDGNAAYLIDEWRAGRVQHLYLRGQHCGPAANQNAALFLTFSDPVVLCDDDVLCPALKPDWLARGALEMARRPKLALLALHHPGAKCKPLKESGEVVYCESVGGTFLFVRRKFLLAHPLPHELGSMARPMEARCKLAHNNGWDVGYLTDVYCYHIGRHSELTGEAYKGRFIDPVDLKTFEPRRRIV